MTHAIETRLAELGVELPVPPPPVASYVPFRIAGGFIHVSGQLPLNSDGVLAVGRLGETLEVADGQKAARLCAVNLLAQLRAALDGDWDRVQCAVKLGGFVSSAPDFTDQPAVINGASEFLVAVMGKCGRHARTAVGVSALPMGACVEVDGLFDLR